MRNPSQGDNRSSAVGQRTKRARKVRIAAMSDTRNKQSRSVRENLDWTCRTIDKIAPQKPDIVALMETFNTLRSGLNHPRGAEIIFFCSAYPAGRLLDAMATVFNIPIVSAANPPWTCRIVDRDGLQVAKQGAYQEWVFGEIDLDNPLFHLDYHFQKLDRIRRDFGPDVDIKIYEEEAWWRVIPKRDDINILDIIRDYELEPLEQYRKRSLQQQDEARKASRELPEQHR
jgi:hypothetical protein